MFDFFQTLVRRAAWRWPSLAQSLWLWPFAGARVCIRVELPQRTAALLDNAAILGLGHDRQRLELRYRLQCGHVYRPDCQLCARLDALGQDGMAALVAKTVRDRRRIVATRMQEDLFDANGYAPGVYEIDVQSERAILAALDARQHVQPVAAHAPGNGSGGDSGNGRHQRSSERRVLHPGHGAQHSARAGA